LPDIERVRGDGARFLPSGRRAGEREHRQGEQRGGRVRAAKWSGWRLICHCVVSDAKLPVERRVAREDPAARDPNGVPGGGET
jgi:hypothetical protein